MAIPPIGQFVPYALQTDVTNINTELTTINNTIGAPGTGLLDRTLTLENTTAVQEIHLGDLDTQFDGVDAQINTPGTGILARLNSVQTGGRPWDLAATYAQGDTVLYYELLVKANAAIAANTAFAWGTTGATWTPILPQGITWKGVFSATAAYTTGDCVAATSNFSRLHVLQVNLTASANNDPLAGSLRDKWQPTANFTGRQMIGATSALPGQLGLVPPATAGQQDMVLSGAGAWVPPQPKFGINLASASATKVFAGWQIVAGSGNNAITASKLPFVFDNIDQANAAAVSMLQYLWSFFKHSENDTSFDQMINMTNGGMSYVAGGAPVGVGNSDMDNPATSYNPSAMAANTAATVSQTECFQLLVGRSRDGTKIYSCWFTFVNAYQTPTTIDQGTWDMNIRQSFKWVHQVDVADSNYNAKTDLIVYINGTYTPTATQRNVTTIPSAVARCSEFTSPWTPPATGMPIWLEPVMLEMGR